MPIQATYFSYSQLPHFEMQQEHQDLRSEVEALSKRFDEVDNQECQEFQKLYQKYHHPVHGLFVQVVKDFRRHDQYLQAEHPEFLAVYNIHQHKIRVPTTKIFKIPDNVTFCYKPTDYLWPASMYDVNFRVPDSNNENNTLGSGHVDSEGPQQRAYAIDQGSDTGSLQSSQKGSEYTISETVGAFP